MSLYAIDSAGDRIPASPRAEGACPGCGACLVPHCGAIKAWHWAHPAGECDPWHEPESEWHLAWKAVVRPECTEVAKGPHRADIVGHAFQRPCVVELQHSPISPAEIAEREQFYGDMVWLFDAREFRKNLHLRPLGGDAVSFRWKHPRRTHMAVRKPLFWDLGEGMLLEVRKIHEDLPVGGHGILMPEATFVARYLAQSMTPAASGVAFRVSRQFREKPAGSFISEAKARAERMWRAEDPYGVLGPSNFFWKAFDTVAWETPRIVIGSGS